MRQKKKNLGCQEIIARVRPKRKDRFLQKKIRQGKGENPRFFPGNDGLKTLLKKRDLGCRSNITVEEGPYEKTLSKP